MSDPAKLEPQTGGGEGLAQPLDPVLAVCPTAVDGKQSIPTAEPQVQNETNPEPVVQAKEKVENNSEVTQKDKSDVGQLNKLEVTSESKLEVESEIKLTEPVKDDSVVVTLNKDDIMADSNAEQKPIDVWQQREKELLKRIEELELVKNERSEDALRLQLKVREEEIDLLKARVNNLETELQAVLSKPSGKNHEIIENIKQQHEELLTKARGMIFDKTKMVKNQELQIQALTTQVQSLKDINQITKDLLEIRNSEVKAMEDRLQAMEARFKAEKDRYGLVLQRAQTSSTLNDDLKKEYETQLAIFKELREKYEQRVQALVADNNRLKEEAAKRDGGPSS